MALELNLSFNRASDYKSIVVTDNTGVGATGYGTGTNPSIGDFTAFNITITPPDPVTLLPTGTPVTVNAYPSLPSAIGGSFTITSLALLGLADTVIPDGVYKFEVSAVTTTEVAPGVFITYSFETYLPLYEIVQCCIQSMTIEAATGCDCKSEAIRNIILANGLYLPPLVPTPFNGEFLPSPIQRCAQWTLAANLILKLQEICEDEHCKGCGGC